MKFYANSFTAFTDANYMVGKKIALDFLKITFDFCFRFSRDIQKSALNGRQLLQN